ncbi:DUF1934 domain-containing protein [Pueribacillus theae]|uniref:DUF1934 domain-containing protein n=2 Tax=Pueribacillus theae TaxID=2171751 RepID=A0A2U1K304_9BACI|nr:DUF1934 domain-containing protein [Pueribacillus theae]
MKKLKMSACERDVHLMAKPFSQTQASLTIETTIEIDSAIERSRNIVDGTVYTKDGTTVCSYKEAAENGEISNIVKINQNAVTIIRNGSVAMRQPFIIACETNGSYHTPFGSLATKALTKDIQFEWDRKREVGSLLLAYDLWMQENHTGFFTVKIHMEGVRK